MEIKMMGEVLLDDRYRILRLLGQGGMSRVYLAENIKLGTLWAIKEINKKSNIKIDLLVEPNILKKLRHSALPRIFDIVEDKDNLYIICDYIKGVSLDRKLREEGKFPEHIVIEWAIQICDVLIYLHDFKPNPVIYRDMKPSNIIISDEGSVKLIDFGTAREYKKDSESDTIFIGTRGYAAPEQYGKGQSGVTADIYSLGVTLYHLVTGRGPNEPPYELKPVRHFDRYLSQDIENIIYKCTRKNPQERYQSAKELLLDLKRAGRKGNLVETDSGVEGAAKKESSSGKPASFKKMVIAIWDNVEFGCEIAYIISKLTDLEVMLIDLDLLSPKADIFLNIKKAPDRILNDGIIVESGLDVVMTSIEKGFLNCEIMIEASVKRRELKNLHILTGSYKLENYEYYSDQSLIKLIEKSYMYFDITLLLVNRSLYDSYTVISLIKSDLNIIPVRADLDKLREFNSYLVFLKDKQHISLDKSKFAAFEYDAQTNLSHKDLEVVSEGNYLGSIKSSQKRARYRNLKIPYARRMEKDIEDDYIKILTKLNIVPKKSIIHMLKKSLKDIALSSRVILKLCSRLLNRRRMVRNAGIGHSSQVLNKR
jgi:serine/threonine protein kinase